MDKLKEQLPKLMTRENIAASGNVLPEYNKSIRQEDSSTRLVALSDIYDIYIPSKMTYEIYSKLYLAMMKALKKKIGNKATEQKGINYKRIMNISCNGILGGSDSFTIIGKSGIGKSSAITNSIRLLTNYRTFEAEEPYCKIIPCVIVQCPFDCSVKGLLLEVLRQVDEIIGSDYYRYAVKARATVDMLIGSVSQVALNHIGLLIVDEIQNVCVHQNGTKLIGMLTQLINSSGISICMVGTPKVQAFFEKEMQIARRTVGLTYNEIQYDESFREFCRKIFQFQYVAKETELTEVLLEWIYEHSAGLPSVVISLFHDCQEIAILTGIEEINKQTLEMAYEQRIGRMHDYLEPSRKRTKNTTKKRKKEKVASQKLEVKSNINVYELLMEIKNKKKDVVTELRKHVYVKEMVI